jgi:LAO/AO transport system ATPase
MSNSLPQRIVLAKIGLDGHDRGVKVVARGLRDLGFHVIYAGLWQSPEAVVRAVADEDARWLGLSLLSGAHMTLVPRVLTLLHQAGLSQVGVVVGGIIPPADERELLRLGVAHVFGPGTAIDLIAEFMRLRPTPIHEPVSVGTATENRLLLARSMTRAANGEVLDLGAIAKAALLSPRGRPRTIAVTGSGGVGKSTLIGKLVEVIRHAGQSVAVLACDPQSSVSGGALLGDRIRMPNRLDEGVLIRSIATPSGHSGVAPGVNILVDLLGRFGFDRVVIETVGSGQGDTGVRQVADVVVVLIQPQTGDELQWEKAGQLEIADVIVVHKSDLPGADLTFAQLEDACQRPGRPPVPLVRVSSSKSQGLNELWSAIEAIAPAT